MLLLEAELLPASLRRLLLLFIVLLLLLHVLLLLLLLLLLASMWADASSLILRASIDDARRQ
jgi:hypothetical protein